MPNNTATGVVMGALLTVFGFSMIWHIWWLAIVSLVGTIGYFIVHAARDDQGYMVPVETIERIEAEQHARLVAEKKRGKPQVTRFKGLGEMNPPQLRETTMDPNTRRLVQLTLDDFSVAEEIMDMLLAKKRAGDRKTWLESKGNLAEVLL